VRSVLSDLLDSNYTPWTVGVLLLLLLWLAYRVLRGRGTRLERALSDISYDRIHKLVVPNGDEGEILIDQVLLTSQGLLILEVKHVEGAVFGSDKMQDWTVISADRRFTFPNPQHGLYDRIAAVSEVIRQVPVAGRVLFLDGAEFKKGVPDLVATIDQLVDEFGESDKKAAQVNVEAFKPHWDALKKWTG
jgi:hypothetical protein